MKKILLVSNYVFHYRQKVYNYFAEKFDEEGYEFHVLAPEYQEADYDLRFHAHTLSFSIPKYLKKLKELEPDIVIIFLHLKDAVQIPIIYYCRAHRIPVIFWNKGLSDTDPDNKWKNAVYHHIHNKCDALITYTSDTRDNFEKKNHRKLFVAWNTVNCADIDKSKYDKTTIKQKYKIIEDTVVLYISRMRKDKHIEILLEALADVPNIAVVAMGAGMTPELQQKFDASSNLYYLGQKYGEEGNEVWAMGDIFSIPVNCGLGINEAIFWNLPIVTMKGYQPPEIYYVKEGKTGFILDSEREYKEILIRLASDKTLLERMKDECQMEYNNEVSIDKMFHGFMDAIKYVSGAGCPKTQNRKLKVEDGIEKMSDTEIESPNRRIDKKENNGKVENKRRAELVFGQPRGGY
ncbi:MAG: glycosyltransferase family 4 protein [Bacteroides thetaiotaomicron]|nr:glycosyltransferase family 4 protein [Bacteroides thetaiotaomicron]